MEEIAIFAGGCFWCLEPVFSQLKGVQEVHSGYIGGATLDPDYRQVCEGDTGHAEAIRIKFNPEIIQYQTLLEIFFASHDPTSLNRQGADVGTQYRSSVFYTDEKQKAIVLSLIKAINDAKVLSSPIVTEVLAAPKFYFAEEYHQQYFAKNPKQPYCLAVAAPKVEKIRSYYKDYLK